MRLTILPDQKVIEVNEGDNLLQAVSKAGIVLNSSCGGRGTCGRCKVRVMDGQIREEVIAKKAPIDEGEVLACKAQILTEAVVEIPNDGRRLSKHKVLINEVELENPFSHDPVFRKITVTLPEPSLDNNSDDLSRLLVELRKAAEIENINFDLRIMGLLPHALRQGKWTVTVGLAYTDGGAEVISIEGGTPEKAYYGLALDIGTTTIKLNVIDLNTGAIAASAGEYNQQQRYGDDVINRIVYSVDEKDGIETLQKAVVDSINTLLQGLYNEKGINPEDVYTCVTAGNTTMTHLFLGIYANYLRMEPYIPAVNSPYPVKAGELGLLMNQKGLVYNLPAVGSYVGGDITSGVLSTQLARKEELSLLIDIGTNGEIVLGNQDWQISCAASAGPCFEGGGIKFGMRAMDGAIDKIDITAAEYNVHVETINGKKPAGICGSGLIDTIATFLEKGIIDRTGHFDRNLNIPRIREGEEGYEFVLVWGKEAQHGQDIVIMETDIENIIRAKAAIFAGIRSLLNHMGMTFDDISEILIAGGFGNSLNIRDAITIGMLPDLPLEKYRYVGNTSLKGAQRALTSRQAWAEVREMAKGMTYLELSVGNMFFDEFIQASFLPHTDLRLFQSLAS